MNFLTGGLFNPSGLGGTNGGGGGTPPLAATPAQAPGVRPQVNANLPPPSNYWQGHQLIIPGYTQPQQQPFGGLAAGGGINGGGQSQDTRRAMLMQLLQNAGGGGMAQQRMPMDGGGMSGMSGMGQGDIMSRIQQFMAQRQGQ